MILFLTHIFSGLNAQWNTETKYLDYQGYERSWEIFVPEGVVTETGYPLVFILHGGAGNAKKMIRLTQGRFNELAARNGFIAVYPNGIGKSWNDGARDTLATARKLNIDDVGFFRKMIEKIQSKYSVDKNRIFVCGISNGGFMAQRLAFELSDLLKGIGVVAANLSVVQSQKNFPAHPVPAIFINGTGDPLVPYNGGPVTVFRQKRGMTLSVDKTIETWKKINGCSELKEVGTFPDLDENDNCTATKSIWINPSQPRIKVVAIRIENGGHTWPGTRQYLPRRLIGNTCRDFNGCDETWNFFKSIKND